MFKQVISFFVLNMCNVCNNEVQSTHMSANSVRVIFSVRVKESAHPVCWAACTHCSASSPVMVWARPLCPKRDCWCSTETQELPLLTGTWMTWFVMSVSSNPHYPLFSQPESNWFLLPLLLSTGVSNSSWGYPFVAVWFLLGKIPIEQMDDDWRYPHDSGNHKIPIIHQLYTIFNHIITIS